MLYFFYAQLKFIQLINVKMPTIVGSMINTTSEGLETKKIFTFWYFSFNDQLKFRSQLSLA